MRTTSALAAALSLAFLVPGSALAQEEPTPPEPVACTAQPNVEAVAPGQAAALVAFTLSNDIGPVIGIEAPESGLVVAAPEDLPRVDMANPEETPKPIQMSLEAANTAIVWLNSTHAQPGVYEVWLVSEAGRCAATVTVAGSGR
jgi:hypothetical protein